MSVIENIQSMYNTSDKHVKTLAASIRDLDHLHHILSQEIDIITVPFKILKEWAYAGFFYAFVLAFFAHFMIGDGQQATAVIALVALVVSYIFHKRISK